MKWQYLSHLMIIALVPGVLPGCGTSAPSRFYNLDSTAIPSGLPAVPATVMVGPVSVPAAVDRPEFVVQVSPNQVELEEFNRWAAPLDDSIARAVAGDLSVLLANPKVTSGPLADFIPTFRVTINIQQFESVEGQEALLDAVWVVWGTAGGSVQSGRTIAKEAVLGGGFEALAAAHSRAIAKVSSDIAAVIRAHAAGNT